MSGEVFAVTRVDGQAIMAARGASGASRQNGGNMSGEVFAVARVGGEVAIAVAGFASRTALAGTTMALEGVAALGDHMNGVVARAEEAHRSACAWSTVASGVLDRNARLAVLAQACANAGEAASGSTPGGEAARLAASLPSPLTPEGHSPDELLRWCAGTDDVMRQVDGALARMNSSALTRAVLDDLVGHLSGMRPTDPSDASEELATLLSALPSVPDAWRDQDAVEALTANLGRVLGRLSPYVSEGDRAAVREAARRMGSASGPAEARGRLVDVRHRVQLANLAATSRRQGAVEAARLLHALQIDVPNPQGEHEALRGRLAEVVAGRVEMDPGLRDAARAACAAAVAGADRAHVRRTLLDVLGTLGYEVQEGFETMEPLRLSKEGWDEHAVNLVITEQGQIRSVVVRTADHPAAGGVIGADDGSAPAAENDTKAGGAADAAREQEWCTAFDVVRERLAGEGVQTAVERLVPPGTRPAPRSRLKTVRPRRATQVRRRDRPE
ncbi:hypothetical protein [Sphaerisporangium sp. TRM90804]|uniref:hypothetical protein n=1 Tax=Sphaerisporangium sp. TRM90804 TaxID=3031113 RepID=UPI002447E154|nr:hypothetical protein [Sphaerisporangium sp. TRM90804]MDH2425657.1 hypothetical protein [Sphaerisporangium sp. TRM90804]